MRVNQDKETMNHTLNITKQSEALGLSPAQATMTRFLRDDYDRDEDFNGWQKQASEEYGGNRIYKGQRIRIIHGSAEHRTARSLEATGKYEMFCSSEAGIDAAIRKAPCDCGVCDSCNALVAEALSNKGS